MADFIKDGTSEKSPDAILSCIWRFNSATRSESDETTDWPETMNERAKSRIKNQVDFFILLNHEQILKGLFYLRSTIIQKAMFDMMKMMGKLGEMKTKMAEAQAKVALIQATGESGAGMVKATVNGTKKVIDLEIDPSLLNPNDAVMLKDLVIAAINQAQQKAEELAKEEMKKSTEGVLPNIPGLDLSAFGL
jgi:DNA-binding YbaB/EbfC family protein